MPIPVHLYQEGEPVDATNRLQVDASLTTDNVTFDTTGLATDANQATLVAQVGGLTETVPATDTASSGLNGRLQRIAQRLTNLISLLPTALTGAGNLSVGVAEELPAGTQKIGSVDVAAVTMPATLRNNKVTVATGGTRQVLSGTSVALLNGVWVQAALGNTQTVYVGNASVSAANGYELAAGQAVFIAIDNLNKVYVDLASGQSNQSVTYVGS